MSKHTPGPWIVWNDGHGNLSVRSANERDTSDATYLEVATEVGGLRKGQNFKDRSEEQANARLIAAAPTGLDAAIFVYERLLSHPVDSWRIGANGQQSLCVLRDFIADATGQTEQEVQEFYEAKIAGAA